MNPSGFTVSLPPSWLLPGQPRRAAPPGLRRDFLFSGRRDSHLSRGGCGLAARADSELSEDRGHVMDRGLLGDEEALSDLGVAHSLFDEHENLELAARELGRSGTGRGA